MSEEDGLLAAVAARPEDDTPRLVYADWLEENGRAFHAEFIRIQCDIAEKQATLPRSALDRHVDLFKRDRELRDDHRAELLGRLANLPASELIEFDRGFASEIRLRVGDFLTHAEKICSTRPTPGVRVLGVAERFAEFVGCDFLGCVTHLAGYAESVHRLSDDTWTADRSIWGQIVNAFERLTRLESLDLEGCRIDGSHFAQVNRATYPALAELDLSNNWITDAAVECLLETTLPRSLKRLILGANPITDQGALALAERWPTTHRLEYLNLRFTQIGPRGQRELLNRFGGKIDLF